MSSVDTFRPRRRYRRSDPAGRFPRLLGYPEIECNRLAQCWRTLIDLTPSQTTELRARAMPMVASWLERDPARRSWFAIIPVPGLRSQVVRHAGLDAYDCADPVDLPERLRTHAWQVLVDRMAEFQRLDRPAQTLVVTLLNQLSLGTAALPLVGRVRLRPDPREQVYAYEVARVLGRSPGGLRQAVAIYDWLAGNAAETCLAAAATAQAIACEIRLGAGLEAARPFARRGRDLLGRLPDDGWLPLLVRSRLHRALALVCFQERDLPGADGDLAAATEANERLTPLADGDDELTLLALEDRKILLESRIKAASARPADRRSEVDTLCEVLAGLDPYCIQTRLTCGDAYAACGELDQAARWYARAGELGTGAGAIAWYRAGQCLDRLGDHVGARAAMARCLELDGAAVEPRTYLTTESR